MSDFKKFTFVLLIPLFLAGCVAIDPSKTPDEAYNDNVTKSHVVDSIQNMNLPYDITVNVDRGIVQLSGFVDYQNQALEVERKVAKVPEVRDVINHIIIRSSVGYARERADAAALNAVKRTKYRRG